MLVDFARLSPNQVYDVCIVGSGPAGMSLALRLAARKKRVLLLEGGGREQTEASQAVCRGKVVGDPYFDLEYARLRFLGGSSNHWGGWCGPLDALDFAPKPHAPVAHWPITRADLDPYGAEASRILDLPPARPDRPMPGGMAEFFMRFSEPVTRFREKYATTLATSPNIDLAVEANLTGVTLGGGGVQSLRVRNFAGLQREVRARAFVIACGGIENSRMLLHLNNSTNGQLVKDSRALGRYWMEHPHFTIGEAVIESPDSAVRFFHMQPALRQQQGLLNCHLRLQPLTRSRLHVLADSIACLAPAAGEWIYSRMDKQLLCGVRLRAAWEPEPRADNRVALSATERDQFGIPRPVLYWRKSARDRDTVRRTTLQFGAALARADLGRVRLDDWVMGKGDWPAKDELGGYHHMGGTRMSATPAEGVVDRDCKVWGQGNLYVAGSSVFATAGAVNPTYSIVQLALRLGDHLAARA